MAWKVIIPMCFVMQLFDVCDARISPETCGIAKTGRRLINGGTRSQIGQFPWLGVWCHGNTTQQCFCSVNLITADTVVTVAHCLRDKLPDEGTDWPETSIHFGRFDLTNEDEEEHS